MMKTMLTSGKFIVRAVGEVNNHTSMQLSSLEMSVILLKNREVV